MFRTPRSLIIVLLVACAACSVIGTPVVDPDRNYAGLQDVLNDLPDGGTLEIFLAHGMRVDATPTYATEIAGITKRLSLVSLETPNDPPAPQALVATPPNLVMDGVHIFGEGSTDGKNWAAFQPRVTVDHWSTKSGNKHVNFYRFEYWQALAFMKCKYIIAPDTRVIGEKTKFGKDTRAAYCAGAPWNSPGAKELSRLPEWGNQMLKSEIMEWGLSDAVIATSQYRNVLHQAVGEALKITAAGAITEANRSSMSDDAASSLQRHNFPYRFVFITESLGSYVISDALNALGTANSNAAGPAPGADLVSAQSESQLQSTRFAICGATQVHMFANQLALLRLSELTLDAISPTTTEADLSSIQKAKLHEAVTGAAGSHFFRGCNDSASTASHPKDGISFGARQVVAYHDPNDLLSYYTSDRPGLVSTQNTDTTNVVIPYTPVWIPLLAADPITAHTGQPNVAAIMDLVACGRNIGVKSKCAIR